MADWQYLDGHLRLRLTALGDKQFEDFFLHFLNAGISLTIQRNGQQVTRRVIAANTFAAGSGRKQLGVDLRVEIEGGEVWAFQCKRHKKWSPDQTRRAITDAAQFNAHHNFLVVACDPHQDVQPVIEGSPNWTFWNLDRICAEFRLRVPPAQHVQVLFFLPPEELKRFVPFTTDALITPPKFFERFLGADKLFRHDWNLTGRDVELGKLRTFATDPTRKVLFMVAKGGDGKSRLLWEFCRGLGAEGKIEALCLNPHAHESPTFAFAGPARPRVVVVDDAHRVELVTHELLSLLREDKEAKLILAGRPQAQEALAQRLYEHGFQEADIQIIPLPPLPKHALGSLAAEALGPGLRQHAAELAKITAESAFFTVIAATLLQQGHLKWGHWASHQQFRQHVFRAFEEENLRSLPEADRKVGSHLLRLLALVGPANADAAFFEQAGRCLEVGSLAAEDMLQRLERAELLTGDRQKLRVLPDLFADFLIYDTAFEPANRKPVWVSRILREFAADNPTLLRNLSEAAWVARANGVADDALLGPLVKREEKRFLATSHYERAGMLKHWSTFSVYLPQETLALVELAIGAKRAPKLRETDWMTAGLSTHAHVMEQIPALLRPIARYHLEYQARTLDLLWLLGLGQKRQFMGLGRGQTWEVIADVIKFEPSKRVGTTKAALDWVESLVKRPRTLQVFEGPDPVLPILLTPCFARSVEFNQWEGRKISWWQQPVSLENTQASRDHALRIVDWVVAQDSWLAALDGLSVLERAMHRLVDHEARRMGKEPRAYRAIWLPERLKALKSVEQLLERHDNVVVRFEVRRLLQRDLAYEEDAEFASAAKAVRTKIREDLPLRVLNVLMGHGTYEFLEEVGVPRGEAAHEKVRELWRQKLRDVTSELIAELPQARGLMEFLNRLATDAVRAGHHPTFAGLFQEIAQQQPELAIGMAKLILSGKSGTPPAGFWPSLIVGHPKMPTKLRCGLLEQAVRQKKSGLRVGLIQVVEARFRSGQEVAPAERRMLIALARTATTAEALSLLQFVEWATDEQFAFASQIVRALPLAHLNGERVGDILEALFPSQKRKVGVPRDLIQHVLKALVHAPRLDWENHQREWEELLAQFPLEAFEFFCARLAHPRSGRNTPREYHALPEVIEGRFRFPQLTHAKKFGTICETLWRHALRGQGSVQGRAWVEFFQAVVISDEGFWLPKLLTEIKKALTLKRLWWLNQLISFDGSLIVFRLPAVTRAFLQRAHALAGDEGVKEIRSSLYVGCGPRGRSFTEGALDEDSDYVEAEAVRAAEANAHDPDLGSFYRWIVEIEQRDREQLRLRHEADITEFD